MSNVSLPPWVTQLLDVWIKPEMVRRGLEDFRTAQVIFNPDGSIAVRLNDECKFLCSIPPLKREAAVGDPVYWDDISQIDEMHISDDDLDAGHCALLRHPDGKLYVSMDLRYNYLRIRETLSVAKQFLVSATTAAAVGHTHVVIDALFSAAELTAKAWLLQIPMGYLDSHKGIEVQLHKHRKLNNLSADFVDLVTSLARSLRPYYRYQKGQISEVSPEKCNEMIDIITDVWGLVEKRSRRAVSKIDPLNEQHYALMNGSASPGPLTPTIKM